MQGFADGTPVVGCLDQVRKYITVIAPRPAGGIGFRVIPEDINGTLGVAQSQTVYIDSEAPTILGLDTDGTTVIAEPTPSANSLQNGTITVRALVRTAMNCLRNRSSYRFHRNLPGSRKRKLPILSGRLFCSTGFFFLVFEYTYELTEVNTATSKYVSTFVFFIRFTPL